MIKNTKIYEIVWLSTELDILDLRLHELDSIVDKFIIVEYPFDYGRNPRPLYYNQNKERFKEFHHKIVHVIDDYDYPGISGLGLLWLRKESPKILQALQQIGCTPDDFVINNDGDAVLNRRAFNNSFFDPTLVTGFIIKWYQFYFNCLTYNANYAWTQSAPFKYYGKNLVVKVPDGVRPNYIGADQGGGEIGYHFAKCGGVEKVMENIKGYPHQEYNTIDISDPNAIKKRMENNWGWSAPSSGPTQADWNFQTISYEPNYYPEYLNQHPEIYKKYFKFDSNAKNLGGENWK